MWRKKNELESKRSDAKELIELFGKLNQEKKMEVLGIVRGYALCAENQKGA